MREAGAVLGVSGTVVSMKMKKKGYNKFTEENLVTLRHHLHAKIAILEGARDVVH